MDKKKLKLVGKAFKTLLKENGQTTSLEVKNHLRKTEPEIVWLQADVSAALIEIQKITPNVKFTDNGTFREYSEVIPSKNTVSTKKKKSSQKTTSTKTLDIKGASKISKTKAVNLMKESKGRFFTVVFIKQNGEERVMNGNVKKGNFMNNLGYINFNEASKGLRQVNPKTLKALRISGQTYSVK